MRRYLIDARHEAAHAVVGVHLGLVLRSVELMADDDEDVAGQALFIQTPWVKRLQWGVMLAAGIAGDRLHGLETPYEWRFDVKDLSSLGYGAGERDILIDTATHYLRGPCAKSWRAVTRELMRHDMRDGDVRAVLRAAA